MDASRKLQPYEGDIGYRRSGWRLVKYASELCARCARCSVLSHIRDLPISRVHAIRRFYIFYIDPCDPSNSIYPIVNQSPARGAYVGILLGGI